MAKKMKTNSNLTMKLAVSSIAASLLLSACSSVPVASMYKLRKFDPMTTDVANLYTAVRLPKILAPRKSGIVLELGYQASPADKRSLEKFAMVQVSGIPSPKLQSDERAGYKIQIFKIADEDVERLRNTRARIEALRKSSAEGKGSLAITAATCINGEIPAGPLFLTTYVKSAELDDFVVLTLNVDVKKLVGGELANIPPCSTSTAKNRAQ